MFIVHKERKNSLTWNCAAFYSFRHTCILRILQVVYVMQVRIIVMVMQDAFQISAVQHCHGVRPRSRSMHTFTKLFHWHWHVSLSHHVISGTAQHLHTSARLGNGAGRSVTGGASGSRHHASSIQQILMLWQRHIHFGILPRSIRRSIVQ